MKRIFGTFLALLMFGGCCGAIAADAPTITQPPASLTVTNGGTAVFSVAVSGTGPFTYQWQLNGTNLVPVITTVAGTGMVDYSAPDGVGTNVGLNGTAGIALDSAGNLFIAETDNGRIRKLDSNGIITTVAGSGLGFSDDGGPAIAARLAYPTDVAVDGANNLYIAERSNYRVRKVDTNGIITTVAGNGTNGYSGDGGPATSAKLGPVNISLDDVGNLFVSDGPNNVIRKVDTNGIITTVAGTGILGFSGDGGPATSAKLTRPSKVALDGAGNMFISDVGNFRVRKVDTNGIISTVAGNGMSGYSGDGGPATGAKLYPSGLVLDGRGNLLIGDSGNSRVRKVDDDGIISTVAGKKTSGYSGDGGPATNASLGGCAGISLDRVGNLFISDSNNKRIRKVSNISAISPTLTVGKSRFGDAGTYSVIVTSPYGSATSQVATLTVLAPPSITVQPTNQNVAVGGTGIFNVSVAGSEPLSYFWFRDGTPISGGNDSSYAISNVQLSDSGARFTCLVSNSFGSVTSQVAVLSAGLPPTITQQPVGTIVTNGNSAVFDVGVSGTGPFTYQWQRNGTNVSPTIGTFSPALWSSSLAFDASGNLIFVDDLYCVRKLNSDGTITAVAGRGGWNYSGDGGPATNATLAMPDGLTVDSAGNLLISDSGNRRVRKVDANGIITTVVGNGEGGYSGDGGPASSAALFAPTCIKLDHSGNLFLADWGNHCIRKVDTNGIITTIAGNGTAGHSGDGGRATNATLNSPRDFTLDDGGNLFIADTGNHCIRKVDTNGIITAIAGTGTGGYSGDGGPATGARLTSPHGLALDRVGNLYICDTGNNRIRKVDTNGIITTVTGNGTNGYSGDGGPAINASLNAPVDLTFDNFGDLLISVYGPIRKIYFPTNQRLTLCNIGWTNAGDYSVVIGSSYGSVTSQVAALTVLVSPSIDSHPASQNMAAGGTATFRVGASGTGPLSYFWRINGTPVAGANDSSFSITNVQLSDSGAQISCLVSNLCGSVTSRVATLTVGTIPTFIQQPTSRVVTRGEAAEFNVAVSGSEPLTYQWQFNGTNLSIITTVAGNGAYYGYTGDGGPATNASTFNPTSIVVDSMGNLFLESITYSCVRKVDTNGVIRRFAGNGTSGYSGDGGAATNAQLMVDGGIAVDPWGNLYIGASHAPRIRKVDTNGIITTVVGNGVSGYSGDGGPATNALLSSVNGIAADGAGNLYIADYRNYRIRKVDTNGIITTVVGNGANGYSGDGGPATNAASCPTRIVVDRADNLFFADGPWRVRKVDTNGIISLVAGNLTGANPGDGGPATNAVIYPAGVAVDFSGNLYISDASYYRVRKVDAHGIISTVAGNGNLGYSGDGGPATSATLFTPRGVAVDGVGDLFIADSGNNRIRKVSCLSAMTPTLILGDVGLGNAGSYSVVVSNIFGCVTSSVVNLSVSTVLRPQGFTGSVTERRNLAFQFAGGTPSYPYVLQMTTNLSAPVQWEAVATNWTDVEGVWRLDLPATNVDSPARFFRVLGR